MRRNAATVSAFLWTCVVPIVNEPRAHVLRGSLTRRAGTVVFDSVHAEIVTTLDLPAFASDEGAAAWYCATARLYSRPYAPPVPWQKEIR
jgi:hypothetical protein